jgi:hypothetical protein
MLSSVDGKTDGKALRPITLKREYESIAAKLGGDAWICGRTTMQEHFAEHEPFASTSNAPAGSQPVYVARRSESYAISVDTLGKTRGALQGKIELSTMSSSVLVRQVYERAAAEFTRTSMSVPLLTLGFGIRGDPGGKRLHETSQKCACPVIGKLAVCVKELVSTADISFRLLHCRNV